MGGTSTDVAHFDGEYERAFETEVAGVRMRAPMMSIHTVAAGGGSILHFDGARFRVGPDFGGRRSRPEVLSPRRPARRHRRQSDGGQADPGFLPEDLRPASGSAARRGRRSRGLRGAGRGGRRRARARAGRRRLHRHRGRENGGGDQENLGRARPRRHTLRAQLLRRRGRAACLRRRRPDWRSGPC